MHCIKSLGDSLKFLAQNKAYYECRLGDEVLEGKPLEVTSNSDHFVILQASVEMKLISTLFVWNAGYSKDESLSILALVLGVETLIAVPGCSTLYIYLWHEAAFANLPTILTSFS